MLLGSGRSQAWAAKRILRDKVALLLIEARSAAKTFFETSVYLCSYAYSSAVENHQPSFQ